MSKYIIEIPDDVQYVLLNGQTDHKYYTAVHPIADLEELNSDYINENYGSLQDDAYKHGLEDAWEAARKIGHASQMLLKDMGFEFNNDDRFYNPSWYAVMNYTASEAIAKLKAYEEKQKTDDKFEFGDEIIDSNGEKGCVVSKGNEEGDTIFALFSGYRTPQCIRRRNYRKTGKHYDIQSILEALRTHD